MKRLGVLAATVLLLAPACGGSASTVPSQVREAIVRDHPGWAYLPDRLPGGYHYTGWAPPKPDSSYSVGFARGSGRNRVYLYLQVQHRSCPAPPKWPAKDTHTLHVNGYALKWLQSDNGPIVWRCLTNQGRSLVIFGVSMNGPRQELAELVSYAIPVH